MEPTFYDVFTITGQFIEFEFPKTFSPNSRTPKDILPNSETSNAKLSKFVFPKATITNSISRVLKRGKNDEIGLGGF